MRTTARILSVLIPRPDPWQYTGNRLRRYWERLHTCRPYDTCFVPEDRVDTVLEHIPCPVLIAVCLRILVIQIATMILVIRGGELHGSADPIPVPQAAFGLGILADVGEGRIAQSGIILAQGAKILIPCRRPPWHYIGDRGAIPHVASEVLGAGRPVRYGRGL